jgi:hypothetical protein
LQWSVPRELLWAIIAALIITALGLSHALMKHPPYAPAINSEQQAHQGDNTKHATADNAAPGLPSVGSKSSGGEGQPKAKHGEDEGTEFWPAFYGYRLKITDTLVAAFTALLFFATIALWWSTRRLVKGAEETSERQLRAYVMIHSVAIRNTTVGGKPEVTITFKNSGETPASEMTHWARLGFHPFPSPISFPQKPRQTMPPAPLAPGGVIMITTGIDRQLDTTTFATLQNRSHALYLAGEIRYKDAFGKPRETDFVLFCTGPLVASGTMASFETGNRIT